MSELRGEIRDPMLAMDAVLASLEVRGSLFVGNRMHGGWSKGCI
jgi:hypothetical protein